MPLFPPVPAATSSVAGVVLLDGTAADIQPTGPQAAGNSTEAAAANHVHFSSGMLLRAPVSYTTANTFTTTSTTYAAISSGNVATGSFTAPASGSVLVAVSLVAKVSAASFAGFGLAASGTVTPMVGNCIQMGLTTTYGIQALDFLVTGLTSGTSYNFDVLFAVNGANTLSVNILNLTSTTVTNSGGGPAVVTVQAV